MDRARRAAYEVLRAVHERDAYANLVLPRARERAGLEPRDAAFATELAYGTLRRQGTYDTIIGACADRPLDRLDPPLLDVLRLGVHQLLHTRVPPHAAVSATVDLGTSVLGAGRARLVNAVLRSVARHDENAWIDRVAPSRGDDPAGYLAAAEAHPRWMVEAIHRALGQGWAQTERALVANNEPADVVVCARDCAPGEIPGRPGRFSPYALVVDGDPGALAAVREGRASVQDEGSQLVALALTAASIREVSGAETWLDACAGPGGKAALLATIARDRGARLIAAERRPHRARLVRGVLPRAAAAVPVVADSRAGAWRPEAFDRVLVDAPCTGIGALRRRPEARWRRRAEDVPELHDVQRQLLAAALRATRPGGVICYATCSPHLGETRDVVERVVADTQAAVVEDARGLLPRVPERGAGPWIQLWPHVHGTDGMFIALLRRR